jgi:hypothetical protein
LKPAINLVHVVIHREDDQVFIASLIPIGDEKGAKRTLAAYTIRLQVDMLGGSMGFMKRRAARPRLLKALKTGLEGLRQCAESLLVERR